MHSDKWRYMVVTRLRKERNCFIQKAMALILKFSSSLQQNQLKNSDHCFNCESTSRANFTLMLLIARGQTAAKHSTRTKITCSMAGNYFRIKKCYETLDVVHFYHRRYALQLQSVITSFHSQLKTHCLVKVTTGCSGFNQFVTSVPKFRVRCQKIVPRKHLLYPKNCQKSRQMPIHDADDISKTIYVSFK